MQDHLEDWHRKTEETFVYDLSLSHPSGLDESGLVDIDGVSYRLGDTSCGGSQHCEERSLQLYFDVAKTVSYPPC